MREWCECLHRQVYTCACPKNLRDKIERLRAETGQLRAENERLREALLFYATEENWLNGKVDRKPSGAIISIPDAVLIDFGDIARAALAEQEKK
jgi:hypothetical protein